MRTQGNSKALSIAVIGLILVNVILLFFLFFKRPRHDGPPPGMSHPQDQMVAELNFSEAQKNSFYKLREAHRKAIRGLMDENRNFREEFFNQLKNGDEIKINALADSIASVQKKIELATFNHFKEVRKLCNGQQQEHFDEVIQDVLRMMARPGNGPPPR